MSDAAPHRCPACGAQVPCARGPDWAELAALISLAVISGAIAGGLVTMLLMLGTWTA